VLHNPAVPGDQRFPHARRRRRRPGARLVLVAAAVAVVALLATRAAGPRGIVLDLQGFAVAPAIGQEPTAPLPTAPVPTRAIDRSSPVAAAAIPTPPLTAGSVLPDGSASPAPALDPAAARIGITTLTGYSGPGVPPSRLMSEMTGTTAPSIDLLTGYVWPLAHPRLTLPFGPTAWGSRVVNGQLFHDGVDLATFCGDPVHAAHDGIVIAAGRHYDSVMGWRGSLGPYTRRLDALGLWPSLPIMVVTDDGNGYRSMYAHFGRIVVTVGQQVHAGQLLGYEGMTGRATGCHLHYGLFAPWEPAVFAIKADVAKHMLLPVDETARVDPLLVLPPRAGINAPKPGPSAVPGAVPSGSPTAPITGAE
jgi:murein DD-endopeptidase MepM/ murein hydrolase activator NlpD